MIWELTAYNTDSRYQNDIRYREYTASKKKAEAFKKIPKIQFTDSGHGIVFSAWPHKGARKPNVYILKDYVKEYLLPTHKEVVDTIIRVAEEKNVKIETIPADYGTIVIIKDGVTLPVRNSKCPHCGCDLVKDLEGARNLKVEGQNGE